MITAIIIMAIGLLITISSLGESELEKRKTKNKEFFDKRSDRYID